MKIVLSIGLALFFIGCSENAKEEVQKVESAPVAKQTPLIAKTVAVVKEEVTVVKEKVAPVVPEVKKVTEAVVTTAKDIVKEVETKIQVAATTDNGKTLYTACAGCHGASGEKAALGKSKIIQGWSVAQVTEALSGYKDGSYGGVMKGVMKSQAAKLSDADTKSIAEYISKL